MARKLQVCSVSVFLSRFSFGFILDKVIGTSGVWWDKGGQGG